MPKYRRPFDRPSAARAELHAHIQKNLGIGLGLGPYLRRIAQASVAAAMISACGMSHTTTPDGGTDTSTPDTSTPDTSTPDTTVWPDATVPPDTMPPPPPPADLCGDDGVYRPVQGLNPATTPAWIGALEGGGDFGPGPGWISDEVGERCSDAMDPAACNEAINTTVSEIWSRAVLTSSGDVIEQYLDTARLYAFLGDTDTAKEAALLVWQAGYNIVCSGELTSSVTRVEDGYRVVAYRSSGGCGSPWITTRYTLGVYDGTVVVEDSVIVAEEEDWGCVGRRPVGLAPERQGSDADNALGDFFANIARLEESAVAAFDLMIDELASLGAPPALLEAAREAREDEVRHTASMGALAGRFGATPLVPEIAVAPERTRFEIALENAVEGCVRETFGALVGAHQALSAKDPEVAAAMREVADDEIRHAELSWAVAGWLEPQLTDDERAQIAQAKRDAVMMLHAQASEPVDPELVEHAGVPEPRAAVRMVEQLTADIWACSAA